jgi:DNA (cytosine-5)-methyltransferase 1
VTLTVADYFCGAGGSSSGMEQVPGVQVRMAANHWDLAIETHNANLPHVDHDVADIAAIDPRRHPATDIGWFSPECTNWSVAKGVKQTYDGKPVQLELGEEYEEPLADEAAQRSRMLMQDVPRFTEVHRYRAVLVENVTDVLKWEHLDEWLGRMDKLGYRHRIVVLNSAFATALGDGAPQLRDRVYFVFWRKEYREPDFQKWTRPRSRCRTCGDVRGVYTAKPGPRRAMRYGQQYDYRCPNVFCRGALVQPYALPAAAAIDWSVNGQRIGDRSKPLQPKTLARIEAGLRRYAQPVLTPAGGTWNNHAQPVGMPMRARTTWETEGVACPPFLTIMRTNATIQGTDEPLHTMSAGGGHHGLVEPMLVPVEGREGKQARPVNLPMRAQTARHENALVIPLRNNGVARPAADHPLITFAAGGTHQGIVMRNNTPRGDAGQMSTPLNEPLRALTTAGHQSLVRWDHALLPYDGRTLRPVGVPLPTQTSIQGDALIGTSIAVDDCTFRMLDVDEIRAGMAFAKGYILLGNKRERVRMLGNAVTPPSARDLVAAVVEAITGDEIEVPA